MHLACAPQASCGPPALPKLAARPKIPGAGPRPCPRQRVGCKSCKSCKKGGMPFPHGTAKWAAKCCKMGCKKMWALWGTAKCTAKPCKHCKTRLLQKGGVPPLQNLLKQPPGPRPARPIFSRCGPSALPGCPRPTTPKKWASRCAPPAMPQASRVGLARAGPKVQNMQLEPHFGALGQRRKRPDTN